MRRYLCFQKVILLTFNELSFWKITLEEINSSSFLIVWGFPHKTLRAIPSC